MRYVYNPADPDLPLAFHYNAKRYELAPNGVTAIASNGSISEDVLLTACLSRLGVYGVMECPSDDLSAVNVKAVVEAAEFQHEHRYLRPKLGAVIQKWLETADAHAKLGMRHAEEPPEVQAARAKLAEWGVLSA